MEQISVGSPAGWKWSPCLATVPDPAGCTHTHTYTQSLSLSHTLTNWNKHVENAETQTHRWMEDFTTEDSRTHIKTPIEDSARYARLLALPESLLADMLFQIFPSHTHTHTYTLFFPLPLRSFVSLHGVWYQQVAAVGSSVHSAVGWTGLMYGSLNAPVVLSMPLTHCLFLFLCVCVVWRRGPSSWRTSSRRAQSVCTALTPCSRTCSVSYTIFLPLCFFSCFLSYQTCLERESPFPPQRPKCSRVRFNCFKICSRNTSGFIIPALTRPVSL